MTTTHILPDLCWNPKTMQAWGVGVSRSRRFVGYSSALLFTALLLATSLTVGPLVAQAAEAATGQEFTMFVRPRALNRMVVDPWVDGVWFGTEAGLFLKQMESRPLVHYSVRSGLPHPFVWDIAPTPDSVWLALSGGPVELSKAARTFHRVHHEDGSLMNSATRTVYVEGETVWVGTETKGLFRVDARTRVATPVPNPVNGSRFEHPVMGIGVDGDEMFISASNYGLVRWNRATDDVEKYDMALRSGVPGYGRLRVTEPGVWVGTIGDGVVVFNRTYEEMLQYAGPDNVNALSVYQILPVGQELWFPTMAGVSRFDTRTNTWRYWQSMPWGAGTDVALVDGEVHLTTNRASLVKYDRVRDEWVDSDWWTLAQAPRYNVILSCGTDGDRLLFGTGGGGANNLDLRTGQWSLVGQEPGDNGTLPDILVSATATDARSRWFATYRGAAEFDRATARWTVHRTDGKPATHSSSNKVEDVRITDEEVWTATKSTLRQKARTYLPDVWDLGNVGRMNRTTGQWTFYNHTAGVSGQNMTTVVPDGDRVWIGSVEGGLDVMDRRTGTITHVYPTDGTVDAAYAVLPQAGAVWVGTIFGGLLRVDADTLVVTKMAVAGLDRTPITALAAMGGQVWGGASGKGVFRYDVASATSTFYQTGQPPEITVHCLMPIGNLLYVGTTWGIDRFDTTRSAWLPQIVLAKDYLSPEKQPTTPPPVDLAITAPAAGATVAAGSTFEVRGTATAPAGARVEVRSGFGAWSAAAGTGSWSATLTLDGATFGPTQVAARLVQGSETLAQTAVTIDVSSAASTPSAQEARPWASHVPSLEAVQGEPVAFSVSADPDLPNLTAMAFLKAPGETGFTRLPMMAELPGHFSVRTGPLTGVGEARYYILVNWTGGGLRLPSPGSGYGVEYRLVVRAPTGLAAALIVGPASVVTVAPGAVGSIEFTLQNTGTRAADMAFSAAGAAASWVTLPPMLRVLPGGSALLRMNVSVPEDAPEGTHALDVTATPAAGTGVAYTASFFVRVGEESSTNTGAGKTSGGMPGPSGLLLAAAVLAGASWSRRAGRKPS